MFIVGTIIGIQFIVASAEEKAKVKEALVPYIVGCFVIFGAFTIWSVVVNTGENIEEGVSSSASTQTQYDIKLIESYISTYYCENPDCSEYLSTQEQLNGKCEDCGTAITSLLILKGQGGAPWGSTTLKEKYGFNMYGYSDTISWATDIAIEYIYTWEYNGIQYTLYYDEYYNDYSKNGWVLYKMF